MFCDPEIWTLQSETGTCGNNIWKSHYSEGGNKIIYLLIIKGATEMLKFVGISLNITKIEPLISSLDSDFGIIKIQIVFVGFQ